MDSQSPIKPQASPTDYGMSRKAERHWWDKIKPFVEIFGIFLLAIYTAYTIKMYCANQKAADAAKSAADTAATQLKLSERSWVGMATFNIGEDHPGRDVPFGPIIAPNVPIAGNFFLQNFGKTPARIDGVGIQLEVRSTPVPNDFPYKNADKKGPIMFPDKSFQTTNTDDITISETDFQQLSAPGGKRLAFHGIVRYHDTFGQHWTKFCLTWTGQSKFFSNCNEHNDADE